MRAWCRRPDGCVGPRRKCQKPKTSVVVLKFDGKQARTTHVDGNLQVCAVASIANVFGFVIISMHSWYVQFTLMSRRIGPCVNGNPKPIDVKIMGTNPCRTVIFLRSSASQESSPRM